MADRAYTVGEIDRLRSACENKWLFGLYRGRSGVMSRSYKETDKAVCVEQLVRTHMLAGHTADDLYASERPIEPQPADEPTPEAPPT